MKPAVSIFVAALFGISTLYAMPGSADQETTTAAKIKARFSLVDHQGRPVTEQTYRGKWLLMFFGYTSCPDICPTTLYDIALTLKALDDDAERIQALFVSVDPERDTVDVLARYIPSFGPSIVGLTGAPEEVKNVLKQVADDHIEYVSLNEESTALANAYIENGVVTGSSLSDARHIAIATVERVDVLVSWNYKHIVNINRIHLLNSVNLKLGYPILEIRSPREVLYET